MLLKKFIDGKMAVNKLLPLTYRKKCKSLLMATIRGIKLHNTLTGVAL